MLNSYQRFMQAAEHYGLNIRETETGKRAVMNTPGHSDEDKGLSITYTGELLLVYAFNGDTDDVLDALGLTKRDLYDNPKGSRYNYSDGRTVTRGWDEKKQAFKVFKQICQHNKAPTRCPECKDKLNKLFGHESITTGDVVYIVEGEKDVITAHTVCGVAAVTQAGGAKNAPNKADWSPISGHDVIIVRDNDKAGHTRAQQVREHLLTLEDKPTTVTIVDVAEGNDLSDHIAAGKDISELIPVVDAPEESAGRKITLIPAVSVKTERLDWLLDNWIPKRSLTLLAGREGLGKSTIACGIAAQATRGELNSPPMNVAYLNTEDSRSITVKPRLQAAGADLERVFFIDVTTEGGNTGSLTLPGDTSLLARELAANNVGLVILDAAKSAMHSSLNDYRDDDVRQFLEPLAAMCDKHDMAVLGLTHFGKRESKDSGKLMLGSVAWSQIARSVLSVAVDKEGTLYVTNTKGNLASEVVTRKATLESIPVQTDDGQLSEVGRVMWGDFTDVSAAEFLVSEHDDDQADERNEIEAVVVDYLISQGGSAKAGEVLKAARAAGLSENAVKKARKKIGIRTERQGFGPGAQWVWTIDSGPNSTPETPIGAPIDSIGSRTCAQESMAPMAESMAEETTDPNQISMFESTQKDEAA